MCTMHGPIIRRLHCQRVRLTTKSQQHNRHKSFPSAYTFHIECKCNRRNFPSFRLLEIKSRKKTGAVALPAAATTTVMQHAHTASAIQKERRKKPHRYSIRLCACVQVCVFCLSSVCSQHVCQISFRSILTRLGSVRFGSRTTKIGFQTISLLNFNPSEMKNVTFDFFRLLLSSSYENK